MIDCKEPGHFPENKNQKWARIKLITPKARIYEASERKRIQEMENK